MSDDAPKLTEYVLLPSVLKFVYIMCTKSFLKKKKCFNFLVILFARYQGKQRTSDMVFQRVRTPYLIVFKFLTLNNKSYSFLR